MNDLKVSKSPKVAVRKNQSGHSVTIKVESSKISKGTSLKYKNFNFFLQTVHFDPISETWPDSGIRCLTSWIFTMTKTWKFMNQFQKKNCYRANSLKCWPFVPYYFSNWDFKLSLKQFPEIGHDFNNDFNNDVDEKCRSPTEYNIGPEKSHRKSHRLKESKNDSNMTCNTACSHITWKIEWYVREYHKIFE